jgi:hypothetical protein
MGLFTAVCYSLGYIHKSVQMVWKYAQENYLDL